jgi:hypothetical protein
VSKMPIAAEPEKILTLSADRKDMRVALPPLPLFYARVFQLIEAASCANSFSSFSLYALQRQAKIGARVSRTALKRPRPVIAEEMWRGLPRLWRATISASCSSTFMW